VKRDTLWLSANWRIDGMRAPVRSKRSLMRVSMLRTICSTSEVSLSRDSGCGAGGGWLLLSLRGGTVLVTVLVAVLVIWPGQCQKLLV
jgi:hypothetical protein